MGSLYGVMVKVLDFALEVIEFGLSHAIIFIFRLIP